MGIDEVEFLINMLRIYSPPRKEEKLAKRLAEWMKEDLGFKKVWMDRVNNVFGEIGSGKPTILLCGHMDTVPGFRAVKVEGDRIYGRGAVDAKSALAAMIIATSRLSGDDLQGRVIVAAVVDEEGNSLGIKELIKENLNVDYGIFGEPGGIASITIGYRGSICLKIVCITPTGHASAPWIANGGAIQRAFEVWQSIQAYISKQERGKVDDDTHRSLTASLIKIHGGSLHTILPNRCEMVINVRVPVGYSSSKVSGELNGIISKFNIDETKVLTEIIDITEPFKVDVNSPVVRALVRAILNTQGIRPRLIYKTGTGDMNILGNVLKIPVATYGPGNPRLSHTPDEYIEIKEYLESIRVYHRAILELFKI
ncbi:MAG: M20/M25/M40 family metallo-hydrolase, partial [Nitrososphaerales archaeon]|nr:M20/M25/M40 family metallo-hydrolase [Nitrososphaerales archaeon]